MSAQQASYADEAAASASGEKINLMVLATSLWIGGAETVIRHLAETIDRQRFNVTVCVLKQRGHIGDELAKAGIDVVSLTHEAHPKVDYASSLKLRKVIRNRRIDVVHTHTTHGLVDATICKLLMPRLKVVHTFHFGDYPRTRRRIIWMERIFSRLADRLFAVGDVQNAQIRAVFGFRERRIGTVPNGVLMPDNCPNRSFRDAIGAGHRLIVGTIATLIRQKGLFDLLQVARRVKDSGHDVTFVVVGEGHLRQELEARRKELGLEETVVLTGWVTTASEAALPSFDVFFQPSLWEAMSVVTLEAMAASKAVVATRVGEAPHVITDGENGLLVDAGDIDGMARALERVLADNDLRDRLGRAARATVARTYTVNHMTRTYERVYADLAR